MRPTFLLAAAALAACTTDPETSELPRDLPARMECASAAYTVGFRPAAWRGTLDADGRLALVRELAHPDTGPTPDDVAGALDATGVPTWDPRAGTLSVVADEARLELSRVVDGGSLVLAGTAALDEAGDVAFSCWDPAIVPAFRYEDGDCTDGAASGLNPFPLAMVRESGVAECADLRGLALEEEDYYYPVFRGFDLRGADLSGSSLHFASIEESSWHGADLSGLDYGYAVLTGDVDAFTTLPPEGCAVDDGALSCMR